GDRLRVRGGVPGNVRSFRLALELLRGSSWLRRGRWPLFWHLSFWRYIGWLLRSSSLASSPESFRGWLARCSFAARLRCHCVPLKFRSWLKRPQTGAMLVYHFLPVPSILYFPP